MKKLITISFIALIAGFFPAYTGVYAGNTAAGADAAVKKSPGPEARAAEPAPDETEEGGANWKNPDSERNANLERKPGGETAPEPRLKEYTSIRKRRSPLTFNVGFSIGALGYGAFGPRRAVTERYRFRYEKGSFNLGFRGGVEAFFFIKKRHCLSIGTVYEQRKIQIKIVDLSQMALILNGVPPFALYYLPLEQRIDKSNVDTNYFAFPIAYRFYMLDEFYTGLSLDLAVPFQATARHSIVIFSRKMDFKRFLHPVDFGGRLLLGFTMNRVFIEIGIGCGFIDLDRLAGERHPLSLTGMMGYKI
jgi:hypothetical protein